MMICDEKLERSTQWSVRTGALIGGPTPYVPPTSFQITPPSELCEYMQVSIGGQGYTCGMAALQRPLMPVFNPAAVPMTLAYDIVTDADASSVAQAIETDLIVCSADGYLYNGSLQNNYQQGGEIQITPAWTNTGLMPGKYAPKAKYHVVISYLLNLVAHTLTYVSVTINGVVYAIPPSLAMVPAQLLNWLPGNYVQLQLDLGAAGGDFAAYFKVEVGS